MQKKQGYIRQYLAETRQICERLSETQISNTAMLLRKCHELNGRVFVLGVGGSSANASHFVNDLRKICGIEAYAPTDNAALLTAYTNDCGWESTFISYLQTSRLAKTDAIFILSVNGGDVKRNISPNIIKAIDYAKSRESWVLGIVGSNEGYTAQMADACVVIPCPNPERKTPHSEEMQGVIWHLLVNHPWLQK